MIWKGACHFHIIWSFQIVWFVKTICELNDLGLKNLPLVEILKEECKATLHTWNPIRAEPKVSFQNMIRSTDRFLSISQKENFKSLFPVSAHHRSKQAKAFYSNNLGKSHEKFPLAWNGFYSASESRTHLASPSLQAHSFWVIHFLSHFVSGVTTQKLSEFQGKGGLHIMILFVWISSHCLFVVDVIYERNR